MTQLLDNKGDRKVGNALEKNIDANARLSVISGLFSIYGYAALQNQLSEIDTLRLLIPYHPFFTITFLLDKVSIDTILI